VAPRSELTDPFRRRQWRGALGPLTKPVLIVFLSLLWALCGPAVASSVLQTSFDELCLESDLIFEGRVVAVEGRQDPNTPFIWTHVSIEVIEVIGGQLDTGRIELSFLGGRASGRRLQVARMEVPQVGEHGVYFVESRLRRQVHPLLGWEQGHFRIQSGRDGVERVVAAGRRGVVGISASTVSKHGALSNGIAAGVEVLGEGVDVEAAMRASEFKAAIRDVHSRRQYLSR
jgi:hypothetical protein